MGFYDSYSAYKGYTTPALGAKHLKRFDREFWSPAECVPGMSVLELGCGTGLFLAYLQAKGVTRFVGVDHDPALAKIVPDSVRDRFVVSGIGEFLGSDRGQGPWNRIAMFDVLEHFKPDDGRTLLAHLGDVLAPGGRIVVKVPNAGSPWGQQFQYGDLTHEAAYTPESLRQLAIAAGLRCVRVYPHELGSPRRRFTDRIVHGVLGYLVMTPPELWSANFFAVLVPGDAAG
jgi:SAM-dependent methyltransferase